MLLKYFTPVPRFPEPKKLALSNGHPKEPSLAPSSNDVQPKPHSSYRVFKKGAYLETNPGKRSQILEYHPNDQDEVRRAYLVSGPCKIKLTEYESTNIGGKERSFQYSWHEEYDWLEYSVEKDVVFCLPFYVCYNGTSNYAFVVTDFKGWNLKHKFNKHVGKKPNSHHKKCVKACEDLMKKKQSIEFSYAKYSSKEEVDYLVCLKASLEAIKYLVRGGLAFRVHNEEYSWRIGDGFFCVLVDESGDYSGKEQMVVVVRFDDVRGFVVERFIGIVHVEDTSAISLKRALEWYDGASNMHGQFGGLKTLIQKQNPQAYYVYCFAHQLQLALVPMARKHEDSSNKRQALLRNKQVAHFANLIEKQLVESGTGLNQEFSIARAGDTRWGSHFRTLNKLVDLFTPIIEVFEDLKTDSHSKGEPKKGDQHIVHVMELVQICNKKSQEFRDDGWETLYEQVVTSCGIVEIDVPDMESLINCVACLSPCYSFESFDVKSLVRLARLYPNKFEDLTDKELSSELETYIESVKMDDHFSNFNGISELCRTLVQTKKHKTFRFVYTLVKLALSLSVASASVERVFSWMKYVKIELRSRMANPWLNDFLVAFVEKEVFNTINDMDIIKRFQGMNKRKMHLRLD
ncbi:uncharacterized protein LOC131605559 [Vicia villosa]|uniref:uncharacterized protein LOC131605559 n=1 Tax=Vicia villosa TaxID=3911 RepID=UPI00273CA34D|nr:uncharacterized protein LOC131605559 [Vicia villosa]